MAVVVLVKFLTLCCLCRVINNMCTCIGLTSTNANRKLKLEADFNMNFQTFIFIFISSLIVVDSFQSPSKFSLKHDISRSQAIRQPTTSKIALNALSSVWHSAVSTNPDLKEAINEAIDLATSADQSVGSYDIALFFASSIYEGITSFEVISDSLKAKFPQISGIIGCTTGAVIGPLDPRSSMQPSEIEARASVGLVLVSLNAGLKAKTFRMDDDEIRTYITNADKKLGLESASGSVTMLFSAESAKLNLPDLITGIANKEGSDSFGALASGVTTTSYTPKVFLAQYDPNNGPVGFEKYNTGIIGLTLTGDVALNTVVARSCFPVGPVFKITSRNGREILMMEVSSCAQTATLILYQYLSTILFDQSDQIYHSSRACIYRIEIRVKYCHHSFNSTMCYKVR